MMISGETIDIREGGALLIVGKQVSVQEGGGAVLVAEQASLKDGTVIFLAAKEVSGDAKVLIELKTAVLFGFVFGLTVALLRRLLFR